MDTNDWNDAEQRVERAQELFEQRKWQEALDELLLATTINPYNGGWFFNIGLTLDEMGRLDEAIEAYRRTLQIEPNDVQALYHLGADLQQTERFVDAIKIFEQIESIDPTFEPCYCGRILCYSEMDQHDKAEEMFYLARLYKEHCPACYFNIGCSLAARGAYDKAIFCWTRTLDGQPNHASPANSQGGVSSALYAHPGDPAGQSFSSAELAEMHGEVHVRIAQALWNKGDLEQARQHYVMGLRQDPGNTGTLLDLADLLVDMGRWDEAGEKIRRAIELSPDDPASHFCLGRWLLRQQRDARQSARVNDAISRAMVCLKRALELDPTWPGAHLLLGEAHYLRKQLPQACQHLRAELLLRPEDPRMLMNLSNLLLDVNEARAAVACLKRLTQVRPNQASAWQNLGVAQFIRGRMDEGIASSQEALRLDPKNRSALYNMAIAAGRVQQFDQALEFARRALAIVPIDPSLERLEFRLRVLRLRHRLMSYTRQCLKFLIAPASLFGSRRLKV